jgi:hypothetical protein
MCMSWNATGGALALAAIVLSASACGTSSPASPTTTFNRPPGAVAAPTGSPAPPTTGRGIDAVDLSQVAVVKGVNIRDWAITSQVKSVTIGNGQICIDHTKLGQWPTAPFFGDPNTLVEANQWVFAKINGQWHGGAGEWVRPGQLCKQVDPITNIGIGVYYDSEPLRSWTPRSGELVGFAVSQPARAGQWAAAERSNVVLVAWP